MVVINGSLDNLQSSLDFYLGITSKNTIADSKEMRDRFFTMFKNEDSYRDENFLMFQERVSDDYDIVENPTPTLVGDEEVYSYGCCSFADDIEEEEYPSDEEVYVEDEYEDEFVEYDCDSSYLENEKIENNSYGTELEAEKNKIDTEIIYSEYEDTFSETEKNDSENENIDLEDDEFIDYTSSEEENINLENENNTSSSYEESNEFEEEENNDFGWGIYDEDIEEEEYIEEEEEIPSVWGNFDEEEVEEFEDESVDEEVDEFSSWGAKDYEEETSIWGDVDETLSKFDNSINIVEEEVEEPKNKVVEVKKEIVEEVVNVPKDLRDFVKLYHNCEMSFALKYFTKKEIDKQLSLGRVFKRKNRLLI
ncbi:hypothetical protein ACEE21_15475 [Clostridium baratii]